MKKNNIINENEKNRILEMHSKSGYKSINLVNLLEQNLQSKTNVKSSSCPIGDKTTVMDFQDWLDSNVKNWIPNYPKGLKQDPNKGYGMCGPKTRAAWNIYKDSFLNKKTENKQTSQINESDVNCISINTDTCTKIKPNKEIKIGSGSEKMGCSEWAVKCLSEYDKDLEKGDAWKQLLIIKRGGGKEKYNMFTTSSIDWNKLRVLVKNRKINSNLCEIHNQEGKTGLDKEEPTVAKLVNEIYPSSSNVNLSSLELGDFVGMYWNHSDNKGKAFCNRAKSRGLDVNGNFSSNDPFTFNTHVGFVGAIKDGVPLIFHNVHGTWYSTPVSELLNKGDKGMITWVASDPQINQAVVKKTKKKEQESWYDKFLSGAKDMLTFS